MKVEIESKYNIDDIVYFVDQKTGILTDAKVLKIHFNHNSGGWKHITYTIDKRTKYATIDENKLYVNQQEFIDILRQKKAPINIRI